MGGPEGWGPGGVGARRAQRGGGPKGWGPEGWGPEGWGLKGGGPKISRFFFSLPPEISFFLLRPGLVGPPGFHTTTREDSSPVWWGAGVPHDNQRAQTCTFERFKHHQNSRRRPPRERRKNEISGGRGEKRAKFWAVQGKGGPAEGCPGGEAKNLEHTHHTHTNNNTNKHQQAPTGTNKQQQAGTTTENLAKTLKHQNWPNAVWPNAVNTLKH